MQISLKMVGVAGAVALAAAHAVPVLAQSRLSIDDALRLALENQPALSAYTREANAAQQAAVAARQLPDPKLDNR